MATFTQGPRNENILIHKGKLASELKPDLSNLTKPTKKTLAGERAKSERRKALGDLSNVRKPVISTVARKDLSSASKTQEEGIEHMYFTGNDIQKLEMESVEKRVKEEVAMATSSMHKLGNDMFALVMSPSKDGVGDSGVKLEIEPEILSSRSGKVCNELKPEPSKLRKTAKKTTGKAGERLKTERKALGDLSKLRKTTGKAGERLKTERKALGDLSNISKPVTSTRARKYTFDVPKSSKYITQKSYSLNEEQIKKCQEWAKEGIEHMYFTGNDIQKLERDRMEKRVNEEVAMVMSSMHDWGNDIFDLVTPMKDGIGDTELKLELEPEILPSRSEKMRCDKNKLDCILDESELAAYQDSDYKLDLKLKDFSIAN